MDSGISPHTSRHREGDCAILMGTWIRASALTQAAAERGLRHSDGDMDSGISPHTSRHGEGNCAILMGNRTAYQWLWERWSSIFDGEGEGRDDKILRGREIQKWRLMHWLVKSGYIFSSPQSERKALKRKQVMKVTGI